MVIEGMHYSQECTCKNCKKIKDRIGSFTTATELKAEDERIEVYNNGWKDGREDLKKQVIESIEAEVMNEPNYEVSIGMCHIIRVINKI